MQQPGESLSNTTLLLVFLLLYFTANFQRNVQLHPLHLFMCTIHEISFSRQWHWAQVMLSVVIKATGSLWVSHFHVVLFFKNKTSPQINQAFYLDDLTQVLEMTWCNVMKRDNNNNNQYYKISCWWLCRPMWMLMKVTV